MVVGAHTNGMLAARLPMLPFWLYLVWGALGVQMFFVISGFSLDLTMAYAGGSTAAPGPPVPSR